MLHKGIDREESQTDTNMVPTLMQIQALGIESDTDTLIDSA
jgi:hypothetical protein